MNKNALIIKKALKDILQKFNKLIFKCNHYNKSNYNQTFTKSYTLIYTLIKAAKIKTAL